MSDVIQLKMGLATTSPLYAHKKLDISGVAADVVYASPGEIFWRGLEGKEFDICEMSLSSLAIAVDRGDMEYVGIPIFPVRRYFHTGIIVRRDAGITSLSDLREKRIGVPEYQQTAAVWVRGYLAEEAGVKPSELLWYMERTEHKSHRAATGMKLPEDVRLSYIPDPGSIASWLTSGELDAAVFYIQKPSGIDRGGPSDLLTTGNIGPFFTHPLEEAARYFRKSGYVPASHCIAIRMRLHREYPWLAQAVFESFVEAKRHALMHFRQMLMALAPRVDLSDQNAVDVDPYPFGIEPNSEMLTHLFRYLFEQGLISPTLEQGRVFVAVSEEAPLV